MINDNNKLKSQVIRLEIGFFPVEIPGWQWKGYSDDLLDETKREYFKFWNFDSVMKFSFDLLPHPNGVDQIFYHHFTKTFSNHFDATYYFTDEIYKKFPYLRENIIGVSWRIHGKGFICLDVIDKSEKYHNLIIVPSDEIYRLCSNDEKLKYDLNENPDEKVIEVKISDYEKISIRRAPLGLIYNRGIGYRNDISYVKAFLPDNNIDYSDKECK